MPLNREPDSSALEVLLDSVEPEGNVRFWLPGADVDASVAVPDHWRDVVRNCGDLAVFIRRWWAPIASFLPRTVELLQQCTSSLIVLSTASRPASLVYCFGMDKRLFAQRGFVPCSDQAARSLIQSRLPVDLLSFHQVHDGFVDFFSADGGPLPISQWRRVRDPDAQVEIFLEVFSNGNEAAGFDTSLQPVIPYHLRPDEDAVIQIEDYWRWLDEQLSESFEDL